MPYTPVEVRHVRIGRALFGFKRAETEGVLEEIANSFESVWRDRGELADKVEELEKRLEEFRQREQLLSSTLVAAERAAAGAKEAARREADLILAEAHNEARSVSRGAQGERDRLVGEARRIETMLRSALGLIEESVQRAAQADAGVGDWSDSWPRQDTREFEAVTPPEPQPQPEQASAETDPSRELSPGHGFTGRGLGTVPGPELPPAEGVEPVPLPPVEPAAEDAPKDDPFRGRDFVWD